MSPSSRRLIAAAALLSGLAAHAFESQCRDLDSTYGRQDFSTALTPSVCDVQPGLVNSGGLECEPGLAYARGRMLGEHTEIVERAMQWLGLTGALASGEDSRIGNDEDLLDYYTDAVAIPNVTNTPGHQHIDGTSMTPATPAGMLKRVGITYVGLDGGSTVGHRFRVSEFAQVPDGAFSVGDFILGNEHCLAAAFSGPTWRTDIARIDSCHTFRSHMGAVNSTHFSPQNKAEYDLYHQLALDTVRRCGAMWQAFKATGAFPLASSTHPLKQHMYYAVDSCMKEALAYEAAGLHFMGDAWSSGHGWERWGSPLFESQLDPSLDCLKRTAQEEVGLVAGLIHGWRSVVRPYFEQPYVVQSGQKTPRFATYAHDQMCMPWTFYRTSDPLVSDFAGLPDLDALGSNELNGLINSTRMVRWAYPGSDGGAFPAAGDYYLQTCNAPNQVRELSLLDSKTVLATQSRRLMTCTALGIKSIWDAPNSPGLDPDYRPLRQEVNASNFDPELWSTPHTSDDGLCWNQRVTNDSLQLGAAISNGSPFSEGVILPHLLVEALPSVSALIQGNCSPSAIGIVGLVDLLTNQLSNRSRIQLSLWSHYAARARNDPNGTQLATASLDGGAGGPNPLTDFLGSKNNSVGVALITGNKVPYLENHVDAGWSPKASGVTCNNDNDCSEGEYCDRDALIRSDLSTEAHCARQETPLLRAFRRAELPAWCVADTAEDLKKAAQVCVDKIAGGYSDPNSDPCQACARMVLPHLRNACDSVQYGKVGAVGQSMCDALKAAGAIADPDGGLEATSVYADYTTSPNPTSGQRTAYEAALDVCTRGRTFPVGPTRVGMAPPFQNKLRTGGGNTCVQTCDHCLRCFGPELNGGVLGFNLGDNTSGRASVQAASLWQWNSGTYELGLGGYIDPGTGFDGVACAVRDDGGVWCVGDGQTSDDPVLVADNLTGQPLTGVVELIRNDVGVYARKADNSIHGIGLYSGSVMQSRQTVPASPGTVVQTNVTMNNGVGAASETGCMVYSGGTVSCWGMPYTNASLESSGQTGFPNQGQLISVTGLTGVSALAGDNFWQYALTGGTVKYWGIIDDGTVPACEPTVGTYVNCSCPSPKTLFTVTGLPAGVTAISGSCAVAQGNVYCWTPLTLKPQCITGVTQPAPLQIQLASGGPLTGVVSIASDQYHTCALDAQGDVYCWGDNMYNELGDPNAPMSSDAAIPVPGLSQPIMCLP